MKSSRRAQLSIIFFTILITTIGMGVCLPVLPTFAEKYRATGFQNGLLTGIFSLCQFFVAPLWGRLSDRFGRRPILIVSVIGSAFGYFLTGFAEQLGGDSSVGWLGGMSTVLVILFLGRIIDGISGGNVAAAQTYIADVTSPAERSKFMGMIGAAFGLGFILGPALGGVLGKVSPSLPFHVVGALCVVNLLVIIFKLPESHPVEKRGSVREKVPLSQLSPSQLDVAQLRKVAVVYFLVAGGFQMLTQVYSLVNTRRYGLDIQHTGYVFAFIGFIGVLIQGGLIRRILPKTGERPLVLVGCLLLVVSFFALPLAGSVFMLVAVSSFLSIGNSLTQPPLNGLASLSAGPEWQGRALGVTQSLGALGRFAGPVLAGSLLTLDEAGADSLYGRSPYWAAAVVMALAFVLSLWIRQPRGARTE